MSAPGFRISLFDVAILAVGTAATIALASHAWWMGLIVGMPVAHFFLFCNVFRLARGLELIWAAIFVTLAGSTLVWGIPGWWLTIIGSIGVATAVILIELRKSTYHGAGWRWINPGLSSWSTRPATHAPDVREAHEP